MSLKYFFQAGWPRLGVFLQLHSVSCGGNLWESLREQDGTI